MADHLELLRTGDIEVLGLLPFASNATFLTTVSLDEELRYAVYKPQRGERPLWDFPSGTLCRREYAAYVVDRTLGWKIVPPTVLREGPAGFGALQLFVEADEEADVREVGRTHTEQLMRMAIFDVIANNADRKAGHLVVDVDGHLWGVDHGICFHEEHKLRTVIWAFEGEPIPEPMLADLERVSRDRGALSELADHLDPAETEAFCRRLGGLLESGEMPVRRPGGRDVPWPPW